ncbi:hypothetical protein RND81_10G082800 [Saponaria officinalis]|uniref:Replication protein A OB domain-containing protein n=1 Tax=Saponaria officinalis TaxID=3572 RepID=A0AAW1I1T8_SAPOF
MHIYKKQGNHIHATIPRRLMNTYGEILKEGVIYKIQHFEVAATTRSYRPVTSTNNIIKWTSFTFIVEDDQNMPIPKHKFEFYPTENISHRTNKQDYLIGKKEGTTNTQSNNTRYLQTFQCADVVGYITVIESKKKATISKGETQLRYIYIEDERKQPVGVTLWGHTADLIDEAEAVKGSEKTVVIITSTKVVDYKGESQLQSTYATKVYINLDIPETRKLKESEDEPTRVKFVNNGITEGNADGHAK